MMTMDRKRMHRGNVVGLVRLVGLGALALTAACTTKGDGLILVELTSTPAPDHVRVVIASPGDHKVLGTATADWRRRPRCSSASTSRRASRDPLTSSSAGFDANENLVASTPDHAGGGHRHGAAGRDFDDREDHARDRIRAAAVQAIGAGGHGGSGTGGSTGGTGGSTGGSIGGTAGARRAPAAPSGRVGVGGTSGTGGGSGTSGTGGIAGTGGRGGTGGTGGTAGTAGRGGTGGSGGGRGHGRTGGTGGGAGGTADRHRRRQRRAACGGARSPIGAVLGSNQTFPSVAVDASGNAVIVYEQGSQI